MNDDQAMQIVSDCLSDTTPLTVNITIADAWMLLSGIQLATRHPELSVYSKDRLFEAGLKFQAQVEAVHPEAHEFIEMGWDKRFDGADSIPDVPFDEFDGGDDYDDYEDDDDDLDDWNDPYPDDWYDEDMDMGNEDSNGKDIRPGSENGGEPNETT